MWLQNKALLWQVKLLTTPVMASTVSPEHNSANDLVCFSRLKLVSEYLT